MTATEAPPTTLALTVPQTTLAKTLKLVDRAIRDKTPQPELACFLLEADPVRLTITGTDLEFGIRARLEANVEASLTLDEHTTGATLCLPARLLSEYVDSLAGGDIVLRQKPGTRTVHLACGRYEANINGMSPEGYPRIFVDVLAADTAVTLPSRTLKRAILDTVFSANHDDDTRPVLASLLVKLAEGALTLAAADGFRLAVRTDPVEALPVESLSLLVPAKTMRELSNLLPDDDTAVEIGVASPQNLVRFAWGDVQVTSRLIEGQFPDYQRIVPTGHTTRLVAPVEDLLQAVKTAMVFSRDNSNIVRLSLTPGESDPEGSVPGQLVVHTTSAEMGDEATELSAAIEGETTEIAFNGRYLRDALEAMKSGEVELWLNGPTTTGLLRPVGRSDYVVLIMPMHVSR
jgi:DNA polymerase III subunit beta